jgi:hypothetical protein
MKKRWMLLVGMWLCGMAVAWSQGVGGGPLVAGIASQIDGDDWGGYNKLGFTVGGYAWYDFDDRLSLSPEITVGIRGSREVELGYEQYNLSVIDVPLLLRYRVLGEMDGQNLLLEGGPSANILLSAKSGFGPQKLDLMPQFNRFNVSGSLGGTFFFNANVGLFGRWTYALTNLNKQARLSREYWRCHFLSLGIKLAFK